MIQGLRFHLPDLGIRNRLGCCTQIFEVPILVIKIRVLWNVALSLVMNTSRSRCFGRAYCLHSQGLGLLDTEDISTPLLRRMCTLLIYQLTRRNVSENSQLLTFVYLPVTFTISFSYLGAPDIFMVRRAVNSRKLCLCLRQNNSFSL
jgi:hypothetical protein